MAAEQREGGPRCCGGSRLLFISAVIMISSDMFPFRSSRHSFPLRRSNTSKKDFFPERSSGTAAAESSACATCSLVISSTILPALKSIQFFLCSAIFELEEIFMVGTSVANGVPRPVVKSTMWAPETAVAVAATRSLPGADRRFSPFSFTGSAY